MNPQPVSYLQTDPRWRYNDYSTTGEKTTIGASGCGPTAMAMVLATWADKNVTPSTECAWAKANGYKAYKSGTYYGYFEPAGKRYGLKVRQLSWTNIYGNASSKLHAEAKAAIDRGDLVIACMGKGNWTSSGHYVLVWEIQGNTIYINDPASTKKSRTQGDYSLFKKQVKYYWAITKPSNIPDNEEEELDMTIDEFINKLTPEQAYTLMQKAASHATTIPEPEWSKKEGHWQQAAEFGVMNGLNPEGYLKRDEFAAVMGRLDLLK